MTNYQDIPTLTGPWPATWIDPEYSNAGLFNAVSGSLISVDNPKPENIRIDDIAHALSNICRFGGHSFTFYSVAQHSVLVSALAPDELKKEALLHDATEAYLGDVIKPLKNLLPEYKLLEDRFSAAIAEKFGLDRDKLAAVKEYDLKALRLEHEAFILRSAGKLLATFSHYGIMDHNTWAWRPDVALSYFNRMYAKLFDIDLDLLIWPH